MSGSKPAVWRWGEPLEPLRRRLERGGILAVPTESSYALAADPADETAVATVFRVKGRDRRKPLPVVIADLEQLTALGIDARQPIVRWAARIWPAALTVLAERSTGAERSLAAAAGSGRLAVRQPAHRRLLGLLNDLGTPLTATSANRSGEPAIVDPVRLAELLQGEDAVVVDDGVLPGGQPSTLVGRFGDRLEVIRAGSYPVQVEGLRIAPEPAQAGREGPRER